MTRAIHSFIAGKPVQGVESAAITDPSTGQVVATASLAGADEVEAAVTAAERAFPDWSSATPGERSAVLYKLAIILEERARMIAEIESREAGKPIRLTSEFDVPGTIDNSVFFAGAARNLEGKASGEYSSEHTSVIRREPIGVVGSIAPWNYPLQMAGWKILPAVAAGNTIVLKPAEITPSTSVMFAEACIEAGMPAGVVNVLVGSGPTSGARLVSHPKVSMVSFTGSTRVGVQVMQAAALGVKRMHMELGGKAPFVVFDDADVEAAVQGAVAGALINSGQDCTAATRAYVQRPLFDAFVDGVAEQMSRVRLGPTMDPSTDLGPLVSQHQRNNVAGFVERAIKEGAIVRFGGSGPGSVELASGSYYLPTLLTNADQRSEIVQSEVFGPVLVVLPFDDDEQALRLANDTTYGLAASVWTRDIFRSLHATRGIRAGCVWVNDHIPIISEMPHGGYKSSGFGKDMSAYSFEEYTQVKHVMYDLTSVARKPWHRTVFAR